MDQSFRIRLIGGNLTSIDFILLLINLYIEIAHMNSRHLKIIIRLSVSQLPHAVPKRKTPENTIQAPLLRGAALLHRHGKVSDI